jgi:hypothetical protein
VIEVTVAGVPSWVDAGRLLGPGAWRQDDACWTASLSAPAAADLAARLRGLTLGGQTVAFRSRPSLPRALVRAARSAEARRMRVRSEGFTRRGARLDDDGRLGLTPEALALEHAGRWSPRRVLDATAGCGGDAIAWARAGHRVIAVEADPGRVRHLAHNVALYGVSDRVDVRLGRAEQAVTSCDGDLLFVDPPWTDLGILDALEGSFHRWSAVVLKLPASTDPRDWPGYAPEAVFGIAAGDERRVKFLRLTRLRT